MIPTKTRDSRKVKAMKLPKNLERLYKAGKCRDCAVVVTRMDFAKILGKFTKVKIQFERSSTAKGRQNSHITSSDSNARYLKGNENGMAHIRRNAYNEHPVKEVINKKSKQNESLIRNSPNILKENNRMKKPIAKDKNSNYSNNKVLPNMQNHLYAIVFEDPLGNNTKDISYNKITITDLLPLIDESILPSEEWCIDYFPKSDEPKDDKVYDRIAAELEDLMCSEKSKSDVKTDSESKVDDFPSIMDFLNDNNSANKQTTEDNAVKNKSNLESNDVEAMLLGKPDVPMAVGNTDMGTLLDDVNQLNVDNKLPTAMETDEIENPNSPSILDEALQKGIEEHLPSVPNVVADQTSSMLEKQVDVCTSIQNAETQQKNSETGDKKEKSCLASKTGITHVVFKKTKEGSCIKTVTCPKNLKYSIELDGKSVEFLGSPKFISSLEDLQVLLQIVDETELDSLYVLH